MFAFNKNIGECVRLFDSSSAPVHADNVVQIVFSNKEVEEENLLSVFNLNTCAVARPERQHPENAVVSNKASALDFEKAGDEESKGAAAEKLFSRIEAFSKSEELKLAKAAEKGNSKQTKTCKESKMFLCSVCGKECISNKRLKQHKESHKEERLYSCKVCDVKFKRQTEVTKHMKIHSESKNFSCQFCQFTTVHKFALSMHLKRHFGEYRFKCDICDKGFYTKFDLTNHTVLHSGDRPYECHVCKLTFLYKNNLLYHKKTIHPDPDQPTDCYRCSSCENTYQCKRSLSAHIQKRHSQSGSHLCEMCGHFAASAHALKSHKKKNHS